MVEDIKPSRLAVNAAYEMGQTMAMTDPRLVPVVDSAYQYTNYLQFMTAHRHRLQLTQVFQEWDANLQTLIEQEARRRGLKLDDSSQWTVMETCISVPLHCAFWFGWETVHNLKAKYEQALKKWQAAREAERVTAMANASIGMSSLLDRPSPRPKTPLPDEDWEAKPGQEVPASPEIVRRANPTHA